MRNIKLEIKNERAYQILCILSFSGVVLFFSSMFYINGDMVIFRYKSSLGTREKNKCLLMSVGKLQIFFSQFYSSPGKSGSQVGDFHESNVFGPFKDLYA